MNGRFSFCSTPTGDSPAVPCQRDFFPLFHAIGRFSCCSMQREILLLFHATGDSPTVPCQWEILFSHCYMPTGDSSNVPRHREILPLFHGNGNFSHCSMQREILLLFHANGRFSYCSMPTGDSSTILFHASGRLYSPTDCSMPTGDWILSLFHIHANGRLS